MVDRVLVLGGRHPAGGSLGASGQLPEEGPCATLNSPGGYLTGGWWSAGVGLAFMALLILTHILILVLPSLVPQSPSLVESPPATPGMEGSGNFSAVFPYPYHGAHLMFIPLGASHLFSRISF